jgi:hypothetical protein
MTERRRARLYRGDTLLGDVTVHPEECDEPYFVGTLEPAAAFAAVRPLFDRQADAVDRSFGEGPAAERASDESMRVQAEILAPGLWLTWAGSSEPVDVTGIDVRGDRVTWR